jgi:hypothetical protein
MIVSFDWPVVLPPVAQPALARYFLNLAMNSLTGTAGRV